MKSTPLQEKIAKRAYEIFEARGKQEGAHMDDWLKAEQEIVTKEAAFTLKKQPAKRQKRPAN